MFWTLFQTQKALIKLNKLYDFLVWFGLFLFYVTFNNISVTCIYMYVTAHKCAGGLKEKVSMTKITEDNEFFETV